MSRRRERGTWSETRDCYQPIPMDNPTFMRRFETLAGKRLGGRDIALAERGDARASFGQQQAAGFLRVRGGAHPARYRILVGNRARTPVLWPDPATASALGGPAGAPPDPKARRDGEARPGQVAVGFFDRRKESTSGKNHSAHRGDFGIIVAIRCASPSHSPRTDLCLVICRVSALPCTAPLVTFPSNTITVNRPGRIPRADTWR